MKRLPRNPIHPVYLGGYAYRRAAKQSVLLLRQAPDGSWKPIDRFMTVARVRKEITRLKREEKANAHGRPRSSAPLPHLSEAHQ